MPVLNYTTRVDTYKTISEIQHLLVKAGASAIMTEMDESGNIVALSFRIKLEQKDIAFRLPTDWHPVYELLKGDTKVPRRLVTEAQAARVAWRITRDWIEAQLAIIETHMVTTAQVFLPYAVTQSGQTLYEYIGQNTHLLLGDGKT
jgi:hypothetical protein